MRLDSQQITLEIEDYIRCTFLFLIALILIYILCTTNSPFYLWSSIRNSISAAIALILSILNICFSMLKNNLMNSWFKLWIHIVYYIGFTKKYRVSLRILVIPFARQSFFSSLVGCFVDIYFNIDGTKDSILWFNEQHGKQISYVNISGYSKWKGLSWTKRNEDFPRR